MVVEAVFEKFDLKKEIFQKLDALCPPDVILASMTLYHCSLRWFEVSSQADFEDLPSSLVQPRGALTT
jgi:hypothetical protein